MSTPTVRVTIMDKRYEVPQGLTILGAYEHAGYQLVRGVGCRGGVCGACATVYRVEGDARRRACLACQTAVQPGMILAPISSYPTNRPPYDVAAIRDPRRAVVDVFPEVQRCLGCNACNKICPHSIDVMGYVAAIIAGDLEKASDLSFDCIACGLCATTCPAEIRSTTRRCWPGASTRITWCSAPRTSRSGPRSSAPACTPPTCRSSPRRARPSSRGCTPPET